jgi:putative membrane protein
MDPRLAVILLSWAWRPEIILTLGLAAAIHLIGRWRLGQRTRSGSRITSPWRTASYLGGLAVIWIALMSPIDVLSGQYFFMHMIQHLLLVMIAPPLLLLANPMPIMLWGLPDGLRREIGRWLRPGTLFRRVARAVTSPGLVWLYLVAFLVGWHTPSAYNAALESDLAHDLEHLSFFLPAVLYWWHVIGAAPHIHPRLSRGARIAYALAAVPPTALTGIVISFSGKPIYTYYETVPRLGTMTVLEDQMVGGTIMWIPGSMMYILAALVLVAQIASEEEKAGRQGGTAWSNERASQPPGAQETGAQEAK